MDTYPLKIGDLEIIPLHDGHLIIPEPPQIRQNGIDTAEHRDYIPGNDTFISQLGAFLVRTGGRVVLLDAGLGPPVGHDGVYCGVDCDPALLNAFDNMWRRFGRDEEFVAMRRRNLARTIVHHGRLEESLLAAGVAPEEVTDVILSHVHCDHVGWVSRDEKSYFRNADIWVHEADAAYFLGDAPPDETGTKVMFGVESSKIRMAPALHQIKLWSGDTTIAPGIDVRHTPGHTPGSSITIVSSRECRAMILGDVVHCPLEMTDTQFSLMADLDKDLAHRTKMDVIGEIADGSVHVASPHFPGMRFGRLLTAAGRCRFTYA